MRVLLLDCSYTPVNIIAWQEAMVLLLQGKAEVVEEYDFEVRSVDSSWRLPSILKLHKYYRKRRHIKFSRLNVFYRDGWTCQYCGRKEATENLTFDHVIPRSRRTVESHRSWTNIVTACFPCNQKKANRTPREAGMKLLREPEKPQWTPAMTIRLKDSDPRCWRDFLYWNIELEPS